MRVLALNGSPRKQAGATFRILETLLAGMADAGAETKLMHLVAFDLKPCLGCYTCWVRTPGKCVHRDGMVELLTAWREADLVLFGTPLYHFSMTGLMKVFLDRLLPESEPWLVEDPQVPGRTTHPRRNRQPERAMLVSPCGFPDVDQFAPLVHTFRYIAERHHWEWMGELLRPGAGPLARPSPAPFLASYLADVRRAGVELVRTGHISTPLAEALGRDLVPGGRTVFYQHANNRWKELLGSGRSPTGAAAITIGDRPDRADAGLMATNFPGGIR